MSLFLDLSQGDQINIDHGRIMITIGQKTGRRVRFAIAADRSISISKIVGECREETVLQSRSRDHPTGS